ncbi:hypothetical protein BD310DRAFT_671291 [Dichomitus squalens]|uniref:Uncharacterized protein n=1 Tax=Dichomitus squalens TaxID=114155 RepID=A0A4Q9PND0_9APHY|nr:hypothetical protein BD310DRAFT_671291 [Dichomitus squalens]
MPVPIQCLIVMPYNLNQGNSRLVVIGAQDAALRYVGQWQQPEPTENGDQVSSSTTLQDSVSLQYHGTTVFLEVLIPPNATSSPPPVFRWCIDGLPLMTTSLPNSGTEWAFQTIALVYQDIPSSLHRVNITIVEVSPDYPFLLDSLAFRPDDTFWQEAVPSPSNGLPIAAIVGGSIVGLMLALACVAFLYWWRKRERHPYSSIHDSDNSPDAEGKPFDLEANAVPDPSTQSACIPPPSSPTATEPSTTGATIVSPESEVGEVSRILKGPKRKGYQSRFSRRISSLRALVLRDDTSRSASSSTAPATPSSPSISMTVASGLLAALYGVRRKERRQPVTPPPMYTA